MFHVEHRFTYNNGAGTLLSSIATPASRTWSFTHTSTDLTQITRPDSRTVTFAYSASTHKLTGQTIGVLSTGGLQNNWTYGSTTGLLETIRWGAIASPSVGTISPIQV